ncbi:DUF6612 family protein [Solibacillus sp. FSL R7-0668]|uniref:DUF6612 family protein n=1 Tax=Solibacillus sp. FSL R7-0668 TaxID=2921688 RepID=UPI0030F92209
MKKYYVLATSALMVFTLAACSDTAEPITGTQDKSSLTLQQVFEKAIERQQTLKNVHASVDMEQYTEMVIEGETVQFSTSSDLEMDIQQNPMAMYTKGTVAMDMGGESMEMPIEMYMSKADGFYLLNGEANQWVKLPDDQYQQILAQTGAQTDATVQLQQLKQFIDDFEFKQDDKSYLLTLNIEGDKFKEFIAGQLEATVGETAEMSNDLMKTMTFEDSKYELVIDKNTFDTKEIEMDLTMNMEMEGQPAQIVNDATIEYSKFDELAEITVPKEVKDKAVSQ